MSVALIVNPPPSRVVMLAGTVRGEVTSPQLAVSVNVAPFVVPVQTVVMLPPGMGAPDAAGAIATKTTGNATAASIAMETNPASVRDLLRSERPADVEFGRTDTEAPPFHDGSTRHGPYTATHRP